MVGCFVNEGKILFVYKKKYNLWQLPQGGVDNQETLEQALWREMTEELGEQFVQAAQKELKLLGENQIKFPARTQGTRELKTDQGQSVHMKGKKYFFILTKTNQGRLDLTQTEFDDYRWVPFSEAESLVKTIYQKNKQKITLRALKLLTAGQD